MIVVIVDFGKQHFHSCTNETILMPGSYQLEY